MRNKTLEELKTIIEESSEGDLFYCNGQYLNMNLEVRSRIDKYTTEGKTTNFYYARPLYTDMSNLHLLSDIENIIELKELLKESAAFLIYDAPDQLSISIEETLNEHDNANNQ